MKTPTQGDLADFRTFCKGATDRQLREILIRERKARREAHADIAEDEISYRLVLDGGDVR